MRFKNTSRYPTEECRALIEFATKGVNLARVEVHLKNSAAAYRGMAYQGVPSLSTAAGKVTVDNLVTMGVGAPSHFPVSNVIAHPKAFRTEPEALEYRDRMRAKGYQSDISYGSSRTALRQMRNDYVVKTRYPYGGMRAPEIVVHTWKEALVMLAAHEARHIYQFRNRKPLSEVDCEKFAAKALERYRSSLED